MNFTFLSHKICKMLKAAGSDPKEKRQAWREEHCLLPSLPTQRMGCVHVFILDTSQLIDCHRILINGKQRIGERLVPNNT